MEQFNPPVVEPEEWTCGKGLAANAPLPAALGKLASAQADVLRIHMRALDQSDPNAKPEYDAYEMLVQEFYQVSTLLMAIAREMSGSHTLPMGPHDEQSMIDRAVLTSFESYVQAKLELAALLNESAEQDKQMLDEMKRTM